MKKRRAWYRFVIVQNGHSQLWGWEIMRGAQWLGSSTRGFKSRAAARNEARRLIAGLGRAEIDE